jgi:hypothetical protein
MISSQDIKSPATGNMQSENKGHALLLTKQEAARSLKISDRTLQTYTVPRGSIPCLKIGSRVLYDPKDLLDWIDSCKQSIDSVRDRG